MDWFKNWFGSPFYKILYQNRDDAEAYAFADNLLGLLQPPAGSTMLDIACGEGRLARRFAEHAHDVTGIDLSHESIEAAKAYETDNLQFFVQDMRMPFYINYFNYAFNFFTSFGYFEHDRDHALAARSFAAALKKGGILVLDYLNVQHVLDNLVAEETIKRGSYNFHISRRLERKHIIKDIRFTDADKKPRHYTETVAAFNQADFEQFFGAAGMELMNVYGDYQLNAYDEASAPRLIMIFKKKDD